MARFPLSIKTSSKILSSLPPQQTLSFHGPGNVPAGMASPAIALLNDDESDYGSEFSPEQEEIILQLISTTTTTVTLPLKDIEDISFDTRVEDDGTIRGADSNATEAQQSINLETAISARSSQLLPPDVKSQNRGSAAAASPRNGSRNTRSPLQRFRTPPKKPLSVTDLVSPAWCELQYWYTLTRTKYGRKDPTPAMRRGSEVHQKLESEVHTTVQIDVETEEEKWALRLWNVIIGLRTLRFEGLTRELEVWGTVDGLLVNGVIDELSFNCPDTTLEESLQVGHDDHLNGTPITSQRIYITDVKTRLAKTLPSGVAFRPTRMQLMLYYDLLNRLASNEVDFSIISSRYNLDVNAPFSDSFIVNTGRLDDVFYDASSHLSQDGDMETDKDGISTLLAYNSLSKLWALMITEFQRTFDADKTLSPILNAEYRSSIDGKVVGNKSFLMDKVALDEYVKRELEWWKGERKPEGVAIQEAFKCQICEFADQCEWRLEKVKMTGRPPKKKTNND
ncbi:putative exonuclease V [Xylogone sp. PMI_703]|nr:putative exonuclease V [Xylogone sp. PMI_703]